MSVFTAIFEDQRADTATYPPNMKALIDQGATELRDRIASHGIPVTHDTLAAVLFGAEMVAEQVGVGLYDFGNPTRTFITMVMIAAAQLDDEVGR